MKIKRMRYIYSRKTTFELMVILALSLVSCTKKHDDKSSVKPTHQEILVGKWNCIKDAEDNNGNGVMDTSEINILGNDRQYEFDADGNAALTIYDSHNNSIISNYTWTLNNDSLIMYEKGSSWIDSFYIDEISANNLRFHYVDLLDGKINWKIFNKM